MAISWPTAIENLTMFGRKPTFVLPLVDDHLPPTRYTTLHNFSVSSTCFSTLVCTGLSPYSASTLIVCSCQHWSVSGSRLIHLYRPCVSFTKSVLGPRPILSLHWPCVTLSTSLYLALALSYLVVPFTTASPTHAYHPSNQPNYSLGQLRLRICRKLAFDLTSFDDHSPSTRYTTSRYQTLHDRSVIVPPVRLHTCVPPN